MKILSAASYFKVVDDVLGVPSAVEALWGVSGHGFWALWIIGRTICESYYDGQPAILHVHAPPCADATDADASNGCATEGATLRPKRWREPSGIGLFLNQCCCFVASVQGDESFARITLRILQGARAVGAT